MRTAHSINLKEARDRCFADKLKGTCSVMVVQHHGCGSYKCPLYKPAGCGDWVRVEDGNEITLVPPEEYKCARNKSKKPEYSSWKITRVRNAE
uniref:Uncharacterized protein n=1 Tax=uncultured bacterium Contig643 TaxID=1393602 RepID=W0FH60_9BACT|nr:hypothetical protein [uncultured bacterium Contig643]